MFTNDVLDDHHSIEDPVAFDSLLQDDSYPDDISEVLRLKCARRSSHISHTGNDRGKCWKHARRNFVVFAYNSLFLPFMFDMNRTDYRNLQWNFKGHKRNWTCAIHTLTCIPEPPYQPHNHSVNARQALTNCFHSH